MCSQLYERYKWLYDIQSFLNGGTCLLASPCDRKRFRCKCPDGYEGDSCEIEQCKSMPGYTREYCDQPIR